MKKFIGTICLSVFALLWINICTSEKAEASTASANGDFSIQSLSPALVTPELIARYIWKNFSVESDRRQFGENEHWQSPEELLRTRKGDCEDFALFAAEVLKANGISSFLVNIYGRKFAHTICIFKENGKYQILDGSKIKRINASTLNEVFLEAYPYWDKAAIVAYSSAGANGKILKIFHRK